MAVAVGNASGTAVTDRANVVVVGGSGVTCRWATTTGRLLAKIEKGFGNLAHATRERLRTNIATVSVRPLPRELRLELFSLGVLLDFGKSNLISSTMSFWM